MLLQEIEKIQGAKYTVLRPPLIRYGPVKAPVMIGFDTEYCDEKLLSVQLSWGRDRTKIYLIELPAAELTADIFASMLTDFTGLTKRTKIALIVFAGAAEARWFKDFDKFFSATAIGYGFHWKSRPKAPIGQFDIVVKDLMNFQRGSLADVGELIGFEKVSLEGIDDMSDAYWHKHMDLLLLEHPDIFKAYATRDPEITIEAWIRLRNQYLAKGIDILRLMTLTAAGFTDFKYNYLWQQLAAAPYRESTIKRPRWNEKINKFQDDLLTEYNYSGISDVRELAMLSYWGGRNEAYWRGYRKTSEPFAQFLDVASLYPSAARLTALPNEKTTWELITNLDQTWNREGYAEIDFEFPKTEMYPNLPCKEQFFNALVFPLAGHTYVTLHEIRQALDFGATVKLIRGWGFAPTNEEKNHCLGRFLEKEFQQKAAAEKGSIEANSHKIILVSLIGKYFSRSDEYEDQDFVDAYYDSGLSLEDFQDKISNYKERRKLKKREKAGSAWAPEWASLILGKNRTIMAPIIREGHAFHCSTDGGFFPRDAVPRIMQLPAVKELESIGSGLNPEGDKDKFDKEGNLIRKALNPLGLVDEAVVIRTRLYGTWYQGKTVHSAAHSVHARKIDDSFDKHDMFDAMLRTNIAGLAPVIQNYQRTRLAGRGDVFVKKGIAKRLMDEIIEDRDFGYIWGCKRLIPNLTIRILENPLTADVWTMPMPTIQEASRWHSILHYDKLWPDEKLEHLKRMTDWKKAFSMSQGKAAKGGWPTISTTEKAEKKKTRIREMIDQGYSIKEIGEIMKVSKRTIYEALYDWTK